jgi:uncharacterized protein YbjT (DUF2867 family)
MTKNILVTGAFGNIGSLVLETLIRQNYTYEICLL